MRGADASTAVAMPVHKAPMLAVEAEGAVAKACTTTHNTICYAPATFADRYIKMIVSRARFADAPSLGTECLGTRRQTSKRPLAKTTASNSTQLAAAGRFNGRLQTNRRQPLRCTPLASVLAYPPVDCYPLPLLDEAGAPLFDEQHHQHATSDSADGVGRCCEKPPAVCMRACVCVSKQVR